jgi:ornithine carbamoyltransferase
MKSSLSHRLLLPEGMPAADLRALVLGAFGLKRAARQGTAPAPLRGKHVAVFSEDGQSEVAQAFEQAATRLGARVSHLRPRPELLAAEGTEVGVLGRLYDAIEWEGLAPEAALRLQETTGIPVFNGLADPGHPLARLLPCMPAPASPQDLLYLVQAVLAGSIA